MEEDSSLAVMTSLNEAAIVTSLYGEVMTSGVGNSLTYKANKQMLNVFKVKIKICIGRRLI